jgi:hypothetical protein
VTRNGILLKIRKIVGSGISKPAYISLGIKLYFCPLKPIHEKNSVFTPPELCCDFPKPEYRCTILLPGYHHSPEESSTVSIAKK